MENNTKTNFFAIIRHGERADVAGVSKQVAKELNWTN